MVRKPFLKNFFYGFGLWVAFLLPAYAETVSEENNSEDIQTLFGQACERIKPQETISSIRMRATDKATFDAVKSLENISSLQQDFNNHDLNVLTYKIVDNYVEDLAVQTTEQNAQKICVEITGYVSSNNIALALNELKNELQTNNESQDFSSANISDEQTDTTPSENLPNVSNQDNLSSQTLSIPQEASSSENYEQTQPKQNVQLLYIAPLQFFNNTSSKEYVKILERIFNDNAYFQLTDDETNADYIIYSKVLRAKVDAINSDTNRMQMVVSVEVKNKIDGSSAIEHQNRFILFKSSDNEQKVAANLMQKLLTKASKLILNKVERMAQRQAEKDGKDDSAFITPKEVSPTPLPDVQ